MIDPNIIVPSIVVSSNCKRVAYAAPVSYNSMKVIVNGFSEPTYNEILKNTPIFSPNSQVVAYGAKVNNKWMVVLNQTEGNKYKGIGEENLIVFSQDSSQVAYTVARKDKMLIVVDGKETKEYDAIVKNENGDFYENIELTFPHDGMFESEDAKKTVKKGFGHARIYKPGEDLNNLKPFILKTCKNKSDNDYSDCSLVIILGLFIQPYNQHKKLYINILDDITEEIKQNFKFKAKNVYILFTPFKKIVKIG